jgi:hypothetical protein
MTMRAKRAGLWLTEDRSEAPRAIGPRFPEILTTIR